MDDIISYSDRKTIAGMDLLALFSPAQVDCIMEAVSTHGYNLPVRVEQHQVNNRYVNNALGFLDPTRLDHDTLTRIALAISLIVRDALTTEWKEQDYSDMLDQSTGCGPTLAEKLAKEIITNEDAGVTRFFQNRVVDALTLGWGPIVSKWIDDLFDSKEQKTNDNLYEFYVLGGKIREMALRHSLMDIEAVAEQQRMAQSIDVAELQQVTLPNTMRDLLSAMVAVKSATAAGKTEGGEPFTAEEGDPLFDELADLYQEGLKYIQRRPSPYAEQGGWLGDALGFVGKAAKGALKGVAKVGKGVLGAMAGGHKHKHKGMAGTAAVLEDATGTSIPRTMGDLRIIIETAPH